MATTAISTRQRRVSASRPDDPKRVVAYFLGVSAVTVLLLVTVLVRDWVQISSHIPLVLVWILAAALGDALVVRLDRGMSLTMSLPIALAAAIVFEPGEAALIAFLGSVDPMEWRGQSSFPRMIFNRAEVACATAAAAFVLERSTADVGVWPAILAWSTLALAADFAVNSALVIGAVVLNTREQPLVVLRGMFGANVGASLGLFASMGFVAPLIALAFMAAGVWGLGVSLVPLVLARLTLLQAESLDEVDRRLSEKNEALRYVEQQLSEERRDERRALAGELHDQVLPPLFRAHLMAQVLREDLASGRLLDLDGDLPELVLAIDSVSHAVRQVVTDLRKSPIGPGGLALALKLLVRDLESAGAARITLDVGELSASDGAQFTAYQVAREAVTNAARYSRASAIKVRVFEESESLKVVVSDDGVGFDPSFTPAGHFGLQLMRERIDAAGGTLILDSRLGAGTLVVGTVPRDS